MIDFKGKVVLVSGAGRGQGEAEAALFAALGARVLVADIDLEPARSVAVRIGERARAVRLDISDEHDWRTAVEVAVGEWGGIDVLVNNAAIFTPMPLLDAPLAEVRTMIAVNLMGTYLGIRVVGRHMIERGGGSIVNIASVGAIAPGEQSTIYGMTKGGVISLTKGAAVELGPTIRVNCVLPGGIETRLLDQEVRPFFDNIPLQRAGVSDEIANAVAFLASTAGSYITGATLTVDGGWMLGETATKFARLNQAALDARRQG